MSDMFQSGPDIAATVAAIRAGLCDKCKGSGRFVSYKGRDVGPCFTCKGTGKVLPPAPQAAAIDISRIGVAFDTASKQLKHPKLRLAADTLAFTFKPAPMTGKNPGAIYVTDDANGEYLGKVVSGAFQPVRTCTEAQRDAVIKAAANPDEAAVRYGKLTGRCGCCALPLSDPKSVARGIGPICASKYGWGQ